MPYVFDTSSFIVMGHYFPDRFPTFWKRINDYVDEKVIVSVREVRNELDRGHAREHLDNWVGEHANVFSVPSEAESELVAGIFTVPKFLEMVRRKQILSGMPVADPFVIAAANERGACVVTEESERPGSARIPTVCNHFEIDCTNLEGFMKREDWSF